MFQGSIVALITPMQITGAIDYDGLKRLIEWHIANGTDALVVAGSTGEGMLLTDEEASELIAFTVTAVANRVPVIAGTAHIATAHALKLTQAALSAGADAAMIVAPPYVKPTQEGLYQHFATIANAIPIPIILYNVPSRSMCDLQPETIARLANISNIVGVKDATGDIKRLQRIQTLCRDRLDIFSGDDETASAWIEAGAQGVISVTANVAPTQMHEMWERARIKKLGTYEQDCGLSALHKGLFVESNPIPSKWALHHLAMIQPGIRLPLTWLSESHHAALRVLIDQL